MAIDSVDIATDVQTLAPGELIELYELDATDIGATSVFYFTENTKDGANVVFNSISYTPIDFEVEDLEISGSGQLPEPIIKIANIDNAVGVAVNQLGDLVGSILTRRRTFSKYLDGEPGADPTAQFPLDIFVIEQKTSHTNLFIEFKLVPFVDFTGMRIPKRQVLRDSCSFVYRVYDSEGPAFDYTNVVGCPYTGSNYFDVYGNVEALPGDDLCGKKLSDCTLRFPGATTPIPYGGFPNVAKIRVR